MLTNEVLFDVPHQARHRRTSIEIIVDILEIGSISGGASKTALVYKSNLNFKLFSKYVILLRAKGFLEQCDGPSSVVYRTTEKGSQAREALRVAIGCLYQERTIH